MMMTSGTGRSPAGSATGGGGGGAGGKYPFTQSQWQELEHQALIYKYMAAGMAIPPELLFSIKRNIDSSLSSKLFPYHQTSPIGWSPYQMGLGYGGKKIDPEPGRCRRTDGKKWRCSKEAYPDSKYCEKHMHRGKNRSRKPVETTSLSTATPPNSTSSNPAAAAAGANNNNSLLFTTNNSSGGGGGGYGNNLVSASSLLSSSSSPISKTHHSSSSNSSASFHSLSSFSPVGLVDQNHNGSLHYGRPTTDHHHQHQHQHQHNSGHGGGSSYDAHFLYPSAARPPGGNLDLSNQDTSSSVHLLFDSGAAAAAASFSRDNSRYAHVIKDEVGGNEHAFFTDNTTTSGGSMRGFTGTTPWGNPHHHHQQQQQQQNDPNHSLLKMGVAAAAHSSPYHHHLELNKTNNEITKQDQNKLYVWGRDFGSDHQSTLKMGGGGGDTRDHHHHHHHHPHEANDKTIHHFFDEWPPKEGGNGGGRGGGRDPSSPWHDASTTQLSISMPTPSHDFFLSSSNRAHNES